MSSPHLRETILRSLIYTEMHRFLAQGYAEEEALEWAIRIIQDKTLSKYTPQEYQAVRDHRKAQNHA